MSSIPLLSQRFLLFIALLIFSFSQSFSQIITTIAGTGAKGYSGDGGPAIAAQFQEPEGIYVNNNGVIFLTDYRNCAVRKITSDGVITTIAGTGKPGYTGDGGPATSATFFAPEQIIGDDFGNLYIVDKQNNAIRKIDGATGIITTIAGTGVAGFSGDGGPAVNARLNSPLGIALDKTGNIYIADCENHVIRMINTLGTINTIAGTPRKSGYSGDGGPASAALFYKPKDIQFDAIGNLYVNDNLNNVIRKITTAGIVTTIVGTGVRSTTGDGGPAINATVNFPGGMKIDKAGNLFFSEATGNVIRKVDVASGIITRIAGRGSAGYSGDNTPPICAELKRPICLAFDQDENLYVTDAGNNVVRKIVPGPGPQIIRQPVDVTACPSENTSFVIKSTSYSTARQWQVDDGSGFVYVNDNIYYEGTNTDSLVIKKPSVAMNNYRFRCITGNACDIATSVEVKLTVKPTNESSVAITADNNSVCPQTPITFTATHVNGGTTPSYQWHLNGLNTGTNNPVYILSNPSNNDAVECILTSSKQCTEPVLSNKILVSVTMRLPSVAITASANNICSKSAVTFQAKALNAGPVPIYIWKLNNMVQGNNSNTYTSSTLADGDSITCIVISDASCSAGLKDTSNSIKMKVNPLLTPAISINNSKNNICPGTNIVFNAIPVNGGSAPSYQWQINGINAGDNNTSFSTSALNNNDIVSCILTSNEGCLSTATASSGNINMYVIDPVIPSISIQSSAKSVCAGDQVSFTATAVNGGTSPRYQWQVNGINVGTNSPTYISANLSDNDVIDCILTSNTPCASPVAAINKIRMSVVPLPKISMEPDKLIGQGSSVSLNPSVSGNIASYMWTPSATLNDSRIKSPTATPLNTTTYKLEVASVEGCKAEASTTITVFRELLMPTAFSPNNDGINDIYRIPRSMLVGINYFAIYNRFGNVVFETRDGSSGWDGTYLGNLQASGTYVWLVRYTDIQTHQPMTKKGTVTLIR